MSVQNETLDSEKFLSKEIKDLLSTNESSKENQNVKPEKELNLLKEGLNYWSKLNPKFSQTFEKGEIISNYNAVSEYDHLTLFISLTRIFYEILREELIKREIEVSTIKECFSVTDSSLKILSNQIEKELDYRNREAGTPVENVDIDLIVSALHGFLCSYLERKKEN